MSAVFHACALLLPLLASPPPRAADLVLRGGKILTVDASDRIAEAVAIAGNRILTVGTIGDGKIVYRRDASSR